MKIILITPIYPSRNTPIGTTPVVHYFAREWVKMGHEVVVFHLETKYPFFIYWITKLFETKIYSIRGTAVYTKSPKEYNEFYEGVRIFHFIVRKNLPSPRFSESQVQKAYKKIIDYCKLNGPADLFIGHWDNPQLEILNLIKKAFPGKKTVLVLHSIVRDLNSIYSNSLHSLFDKIDVVGFRSSQARAVFQEKYFIPKHTFVASSGISEDFVYNSKEKYFTYGVRSFVFVGSLIQRKHPRMVLSAVSAIYVDEPYKVTYIGDGDESRLIRSDYEHLKYKGNIELTGRIERSEIIKYLKQSDVFVMISDHETFGLVYLEAMSMGCVTIASKGGGMDGIIINGKNGFLCNPGDENNLKEIISIIKNLSEKELQLISKNAVMTALKYSDHNVAVSYLDSIISDNRIGTKN